MELRYLARAGDDDRVLDLASPGRFREQFVEGRGPAEIQDDIGLAFQAAGRKRRADRLLPLLLSRQEIELRAESISDGVVDAWLALGDRRAARSLLDAGDHGLSDDAAYRLIDADLAAGDMVVARSSFQAVEPLDLLMGVKPVTGTMGDDGLEEWAERSLAFRPTPQVLKMLGRLYATEDAWRPVDLEDLRWRLRLAALTQLDSLTSALKTYEGDEIIDRVLPEIAAGSLLIRSGRFRANAVRVLLIDGLSPLAAR